MGQPKEIERYLHEPGADKKWPTQLSFNVTEALKGRGNAAVIPKGDVEG